jgi:ribonuclease R
MLKPDDYYEHSRDGLAMVGRRRRKRIRLGDPITVEIAAVDVAKRQVDLIHVVDD